MRRRPEVTPSTTSASRSIDARGSPATGSRRLSAPSRGGASTEAGPTAAGGASTTPGGSSRTRVAQIVEPDVALQTRPVIDTVNCWMCSRKCRQLGWTGMPLLFRESDGSDDGSKRVTHFTLCRPCAAACSMPPGTAITTVVSRCHQTTVSRARTHSFVSFLREYKMLLEVIAMELQKRRRPGMSVVGYSEMARCLKHTLGTKGSAAAERDIIKAELSLVESNAARDDPGRHDDISDDTVPERKGKAGQSTRREAETEHSERFSTGTSDTDGTDDNVDDEGVSGGGQSRLHWDDPRVGSPPAATSGQKHRSQLTGSGAAGSGKNSSGTTSYTTTAGARKPASPGVGQGGPASTHSPHVASSGIKVPHRGGVSKQHHEEEGPHPEGRRTAEYEDWLVSPEQSPRHGAMVTTAPHDSSLSSDLNISGVDLAGQLRRAADEVTSALYLRQENVALHDEVVRLRLALDNNEDTIRNLEDTVAEKDMRIAELRRQNMGLRDERALQSEADEVLHFHFEALDHFVKVITNQVVDATYVKAVTYASEAWCVASSAAAASREAHQTRRQLQFMEQNLQHQQQVLESSRKAVLHAWTDTNATVYDVNAAPPPEPIIRSPAAEKMQNDIKSAVMGTYVDGQHGTPTGKIVEADNQDSIHHSSREVRRSSFVRTPTGAATPVRTGVGLAVTPTTGGTDHRSVREQLHKERPTSARSPIILRRKPAGDSTLF